MKKLYAENHSVVVYPSYLGICQVNT